MQRHPKTADSDGGSALVVVVAVGAVLAMIMAVLVASSVNGLKQARSDSDWNAALAAAYAGIDEYQSRLSSDTTYYRFGNAASSFSAGSTLTADASNPAFGLGTAGPWATVSDTGGRAQFRYEVDNKNYATSGRIRVRSTGKVGTQTRTLIADLKQQGFIDFLYFTDYEVQDPNLFASTDATCFSDAALTTMKYGWDGRPTASNKCHDISFGGNDVIDGPVHSNDTLRVCAATFKGTVTTAKPSAPYYLAQDSNANSCTGATFTLAGYPTTSNGKVGMPATNSELKKETRTDLAEVPRPGCLYTGPTQIQYFTNGTMNIKSPYTKYTRIGDAASTKALASTPPECGSISALNSPAGATIAVPENNVLYVQNVPTISADANYWPSSGAGSTPTGFVCTANIGWTLGTSAAGNLSGYPMAGERPPTATTYGCRSGDVYVNGAFKGTATVAAENYIFVVGDISYVDANDDMLGLVGNNAIWVWNPVKCATNCGTATTVSATGSTATYTNLLAKNRTINAAVLSVAHTFQVQNYNLGAQMGALTVLGAIAQKYRGTVALSGSTGYVKNYVYDTRFKYKAPPRFLNPVTTTYGVTTWVETSAAFASNGAAR